MKITFEERLLLLLIIKRLNPMANIIRYAY